ncbi:tetratricopeptide repeat protein [Anaeroselena agilis]|uniref:Tetratricopeptide repeat protein n=1 Tax=Anaeroselena agilis TaxID=3063788 RepID=A0ABU3P1Y5_9FIRM|nr:tetratricopeptide repeat protein [Selenomonadales bacterium 4137-cl]
MATTNEKATVSARVNVTAVKALKNLKVPLSDVIEAGVFHFLLLDDFAKVKFLIQNNEDVVNLKNLAAAYGEENGNSWPEILRAVLDPGPDGDVKSAVRELKAVAKNVDDRGDEVFFRKRIAGLDTTALLQEAHLHMLRSSFAAALVLYESAVRHFEAEGNEQETGKTLALIGRCQQSLGRYADALDAYERARRVLEQQDLPHELARIFYDRGTCYQLTGRYDEACASFEEARVIFEGLGNYEEVRRSFAGIGACLNFMGDKKRVLEFFDLFIARILRQKELVLAGMAAESRRSPPNEEGN